MVREREKEAEKLRAECEALAAELETAGREISRLQVELAKEKRAIQAVELSLSFRLGRALVKSGRKPARIMVLLSYRLLKKSPDSIKRTIQNVAKKSGLLTSLQSFAETATTSPATERAKRGGLQANKAHILETVKQRMEEIKRETGDTGIHAVVPRREGLKIAVIVDGFTYECFKPEATLITFGPEGWEQILSASRPDLLLVESAWRGKDSSWRLQIVNLGQKLPSQLPEVVKWCKAHNIPTVFWSKEDPTHYNDFLEAAKLFDYVFTTDADCIERYKKDLGHDNVLCLPFAAQPRIHNPVGSAKKIRDVGFAGSWYATGHDDRVIQMKYVLEPALEYDVDIFDRNYSRNVREFRFPDEYQPNIVGELGYDEMVYAYKMYKLFLNTNIVQQSPTMFARRVPEILASGTCVLSGYSRGIENLIGADIVKIASSPEEVKRYLDLLLGDEDLRDRLAHLGLRKVMKEHTYKNRLDYVLQTVDIGEDRNDIRKKGVSVITCLDKLDYMDNVFANYDRQDYDDKELIIILNDYHLNLGEWKQKAKGYPNVTFYQMNDKESLGVCLNYGVERARFEHISKFDDASYYGPAFLGDLMDAFEYTDANIVGKSAHYLYFEESDILALKFEDREHCYTDSVAGSAFVTKREVFDKVRFPSDGSGGEDIRFLQDSVKGGSRVYSTDRFNYVAIRKASRELGTREVADKVQLGQCRMVGGVRDYIRYSTC